MDTIITAACQVEHANKWNRVRNGSSGGEPDRIKILAICLQGADSVGSSLETVLQAVPSVKFVRQAISEMELMDPGRKLSGQLAKFQPSLVLLCLPAGAAAMAKVVFEAIRRKHFGLPVLLILESAEPEELRRLIDLGAADFCLMPLRSEDLLPRLMRWHRSEACGNEVVRDLNERLGLDKFIGSSPSFVEAIQGIPKLARCDANVFITGETGTGKEMCARAIHHLGPRAGHPFVPVNCGAIPSELMENELFGHEAGAFTGAASAAKGLVHDAESGTLFLDEIDSLPLQTQVKLLRFLQDQEYRPLGGRKTCQADIRIIAACNVEPEAIIRSGKFRSDLFYRLNILPLRLPALRERRDDIPVLAIHFIAKYARDFSLPMKELSRTALDKLVAYEWPGNVRELENSLARALVLSEQTLITNEDIWLPGTAASAEEMSFKALKARAIAEFETTYIRRLLLTNDGNISKAARVAKKNRRAFWQLMRKHDLVSQASSAVQTLVGQAFANPRVDLS
jgi:two-component system response regulator GlrR